jgi:signal transduction histidine kinase
MAARAEVAPPVVAPAEMVARTLRHQVGDLLQSVYATLALVRARLTPTQERERTLLADLRLRAEVCRREIDAVQDLVCPLRLDTAALDLSVLVRELVETAQARSAVPVRVQTAGPLEVVGDGRRLTQVGEMLLAGACQAARSRVEVSVAPYEGGAEWDICDDGPGLGPEQSAWLDHPFGQTREARTGLGLALGRRVARAHGGELSADNLPEGGTRVRLRLPAGGVAER